MKYIHIIIFLMTHDLAELKEVLNAEYNNNKKFLWRRVIRGAFKHQHPFLFWWRIANEMFLHGNKKQKLVSKKIHSSLVSKYNIDIGLGAKIGKKFSIAHYIGIVITDCAEIGDNCHIKQNSVIGVKYHPKGLYLFEEYSKINKIKIGNNVSIGSNVCILGNQMTIGDNVTIGAASLINKDIPSNCTVYNEKKDIIIMNKI